MALNPTVPTKKFSQFAFKIPLSSDYLVGYTTASGAGDAERKYLVGDIITLTQSQVGDSINDVLSNQIAPLTAEVDNLLTVTIPSVSSILTTRIDTLSTLYTTEIAIISADILLLDTNIDALSTQVLQAQSQVQTLSTQSDSNTVIVQSLCTDVLGLSADSTTNRTNIAAVSSQVQQLSDNRFIIPQFVSTDYTLASANGGEIILFTSSGKTLYLPPTGIPDQMRFSAAIAMSGSTNLLRLSALPGATIKSYGTVVETSYDTPLFIFHLSGGEWYIFGDLTSPGVYELEGIGVEVGVRSDAYTFELQNMGVEVGTKLLPYVQLETFGVESVVTGSEYAVQLETFGAEAVVTGSEYAVQLETFGVEVVVASAA